MDSDSNDTLTTNWFFFRTFSLSLTGTISAVGRHKSWQTRTFLVFALIYTITIILSHVVLHNIIYGIWYKKWTVTQMTRSQRTDFFLGPFPSASLARFLQLADTKVGRHEHFSFLPLYTQLLLFYHTSSYITLFMVYGTKNGQWLKWHAHNELIFF